MKYNRLLERQLRQYYSGLETEDLKVLLEAISASYDHLEKDRLLIERAMDISSNELMQKNQSLKEKNEMLDSFVYRVSHDLKAPANNIQSMLFLLKKYMDTDNEMIREIIQHIEKAIRNLDRTIIDMLEMTKVEKGQYVSVQNNLKAAVEEQLNIFASEIYRKEIHVENLIEPSTNIQIPKENLTSILHNLISNAIKYSDSGKSEKHLIFRSVENGEYLKMEVEDNGIGIDLNTHRSKVFKMFQRFHSHVEGSGVGLYIVKKIMDMQGGSVDIKSQPGVGSTFIIKFNKELEGR